MLTETDDYDALIRDFRWDIPARFNLATACCDRHADGTGRLALIYVDEDGGTSRTSFDDIGVVPGRSENSVEKQRRDPPCGPIQGSPFGEQAIVRPILHVNSPEATLSAGGDCLDLMHRRPVGSESRRLHSLHRIDWRKGYG